MTVLLSCWCCNSPIKFLDCILYLYKCLCLEISKFECLCWMTGSWNRKRQGSWRCSPISTTTTAIYYWAASGSTDTSYASSDAESVESTNWWSTAWQAWWILEGTSPGVFSCHWSTRSRWLASCSGKATQHSAVRWLAEGVVRVGTTPGRSSRLVGGIRVWTSH